MIKCRPAVCRASVVSLWLCVLVGGAPQVPCAAQGTAIAGVADPPELTATSAVLVDVASGQVLYELAADEKRYPASLTKIMTALLVLEEGDLDDVVVVSAAAAAVGEATVHLAADDRLGLRDLLAAALLPSANDASVALAEHIDGSVEAFVDRMNTRAAALGLTATHFENPHGLHHADHVTSARDLARLAREALRLPEFRRVVARSEAEISLQRKAEKQPRKVKLTSSNRLVRRDSEHYWQLADGIKTGYTRPAGRCLAASASQNGWQLVCVVLQCKSSWPDARALLEWGFANFARQRVVSAGQTTADVHVVDGAPPLVAGVAKSSIDTLVAVKAPVPTPRVAESYPTAPVASGSRVGELIVSQLDGTELRATLVAPCDVPRSLAARIRDHLGGMIAALVGLALLGALIVHGAVTKAAGARRSRGTKGVRRDHQTGPRDG